MGGREHSTVPPLCAVDQPFGAESFDRIDGIIDDTMRIGIGFARPREGAGRGFRLRPEALTPIKDRAIEQEEGLS